MNASVLDSLLSQTVPAASASSNPPFVLITDSLLQPGLLLLREFVSTSLERGEYVVIISLEQSHARLIPQQSDASKIHLINPSFEVSFASTSTLPSSSDPVPANLKEIALDVVAVLEKRPKGSSVTVVVDSMNALAEHSVHGMLSLVSKVLKKLETLPGSRLVALHHASFPSAHLSSPPIISPSLLPTLLSPTTSTSTIHLTLHPSLLLELLSREYGLSIPLLPNASLDIRLFSFLASFNSRFWGDPFLRPQTSEREDERVPLDLGGAEGTGCVVEWSVRGVPWLGGSTKRGEPKKVVAGGMQGVRKLGGRWRNVPLKEVLRAELMKSATVPIAVATTSKPVEPPLPFNLSLTDDQKLAREDVVLPYLPKEGGIEYVPDSADDFDDDDADEDLEI